MTLLRIQGVRPIGELADRLSYGKNALPEGYLHSLDHIRWRGSCFAKSIAHKPLEEGLTTNRGGRDKALQTQRDISEAVREYFHTSGEPMTSAVLALFMFGMYEQMGGTERGPRADLGYLTVASTMQQALTKAVLNMKSSDRLAFCDILPIHCRVDAATWQKILAGAVATARLAYAFLREGRAVYSPSAYYDIHYSGDLAVEVGDVGDKVLYFQIKSIGGQRTTELKIISSSANDIKKRLVGGARQFSIDINRPVIPVLAEIGLTGEAPYNLETCERVRSATRRLLRELEDTAVAR